MKSARILAALLLSILAICVGASAQQVPKANWAKYQGNKIRYYDLGNRKAKQALVLVHCWTCNVEFWRDQYNAFPEYRVIAMDLPGHGQSDKPKIDYSMEFFAGSVDAVMKKAGVKKAVLAGHSMGTPIIRRYYELHPDKTLGLILVDGALKPFTTKEQIDQFFQPLYADYKNNVAAKFLDPMLEPTHASVKPFIRESMLATPDYVAVSAMKLMNADAYATHGKIDVPMIAIMAPNPYWPKDLEQQYRAVAPRTEFHMWSGVSHFLHMEKPKEFNEQVKDFISKNKLL